MTKNKGTSINYFGDWEAHGNRQGTYGTFKSPGQTYTQEWGFGQVLPLSKDFSKLIQLGVIGYDQWQLTDSVGTFAVNTPGPTKYEHEYEAFTRSSGNTIVFGGSWTLRIPKPLPPSSH